MVRNRVTTGLVWSLLCAAGLPSCTSITANPLQAGVSKVRIIENPKVIVDDYLPTIRECFQARGIETEVAAEPTAAPDEVTMTYTALRTWDITTFLSNAHVILTRNGTEIGSVYFKLTGGGGLDLNKFASTKSKVKRMCDKLLVNYPTKEVPPHP